MSSSVQQQSSPHPLAQPLTNPVGVVEQNGGLFLAEIGSNRKWDALECPMLQSKREKKLWKVAVLGKDDYPYFEVSVGRLFKKANQLNLRYPSSEKKLQLLFQRLEALKLRASNHTEPSGYGRCKYHDLMFSLDKLRDHLLAMQHMYLKGEVLVPVRNGNAQGAWATRSELSRCMALHHHKRPSPLDMAIVKSGTKNGAKK